MVNRNQKTVRFFLAYFMLLFKYGILLNKVKQMQLNNSCYPKTFFSNQYHFPALKVNGNEYDR